MGETKIILTQSDLVHTVGVYNSLSALFQNNTHILEAATKAGLNEPLTPEKAYNLAQENQKFRKVLEEELEKANLLSAWREFVASYERKLAFDMAKIQLETVQKSNLLYDNLKSIQQNQEDLEKLGEKSLKFIKPRKP